MFGRIFGYAFILLAIADIYIYFLFIHKLTKSILLRLLWFVPSVLLLIGLYYFFFSGHKSDLRDIFTIVFIVIALPKIFFSIVSLLDLPLRYFFKLKIYPFTIAGMLVAASVLFIAIYGRTIGKTKFEIKEIEFSSSDLPASFDGYKIVQISDIHLGNWDGEKAPIEKMVEIINTRNPDAVMITGDLVNHKADEIDGYENILSSIKARDGIFSVLGNHDYGPYYRWSSKEKEKENIRSLIERQGELSWKLLNNSHAYIVRGNDSIAIIGVENAGNPPFPDYGDLPKAMKGAEEIPFKILLSHDPTHWRREVLDTDINLMLAGHTHATQFKIGSFSFASSVYDEWQGMYTQKDQSLYVNVGIGFVGLPFRFGAWPEITVITLKKIKQ